MSSFLFLGSRSSPEVENMALMEGSGFDFECSWWFDVILFKLKYISKVGLIHESVETYTSLFFENARKTLSALVLVQICQSSNGSTN